MWENHKTSIIIGAAIIALLLAFWYMQAFAFVFFLSILLTLLLLDPVDKLSLKMPRGLASLLVLGGFLVIFLGLITIVSSNFIPTLSRFTDELPTLATNIQQLNGLTETGLFQKGVDEAWAELTAISTKAIKSSLLIAFSLFNKLIDFVIILFLTFYLLMDGDKIKLYVAHLFPDKDKKRIVSLLDEILLALRTYIRSQLVISSQRIHPGTGAYGGLRLRHSHDSYPHPGADHPDGSLLPDYDADKPQPGLPCHRGQVPAPAPCCHHPGHHPGGRAP